MAEQIHPTAAPVPLFIDLSGKRILVVGGGAVATRKVLNLASSGCDLRVVAPQVSPQIAQLELEGAVSVFLRGFQPEDAQGCFMVIAATNDAALNQQIEQEAHARGALTNRTDSSSSEVMVPSSFTRGTLQVAVSSSGASPSFSRMVRKTLEQVIDPAFEEYTLFLTQLRALALVQVTDSALRRSLLLNLDHNSYLERIRQGETLQAATELSALLKEQEA